MTDPEPGNPDLDPGGPDPADRFFERWLEARRPEDLARVFDLVAPRLLLLASHVLGGRGDAEDALQATFLRVLEIAPTRFERGRPVLPWLTGVLVREARKVRERGRRRPDPERLSEASAPRAPEAAAIDAEVREALERGIAQMPDTYAEVLTLRLVHGLTPTAIAHALRMSPETVKTRLRRGGERLRKKLPAGLASAVVAALTLGTRQLTAIREVVLAGAAQLAGTAGATALAATATKAGTQLVGRQVARWALGVVAAAAVATGTWVALDDEQPTPRLDPAARRVVEAVDDPEPVRRAVPGTSIDEEVVAGSPDQPPRGLLSFEGELVDDRFRPLEGVRVRAVRLHPALLSAPLGLLPVPRTDIDWVVAEGVTDVGGRYLLEGVPPGGALVFRFDPPAAPPWLDLLGERPAPGDHVELGRRQLPRTRFARGRILDPRGRGIEGAVLRRRPGGEDFRAERRFGLAGRALDGWLRSRWREPRAVALAVGGGELMVADVPPWLVALADVLDPTVAVSGPDGRFTWAARSGSPVEVEIDAEGFAARPFTLTPADPVFEHDPFALEALPECEIDVVDVRGRPVPAGIEVAVGTPLEGSAALRRLGETDAEGRLFAPVSRARRQWFAVRAPGEPWHAVDLEPRPPFVIRLPARHQLELRVRDLAAVGLPGVELRLVPGVRELVLHQLGALPGFDLTGRLEHIDDGLVRIDDLPSGPWTALVAAEGHFGRAFELDLRGNLRRNLVLTEGGVTDLEVLGQAFEAQPDRAVLMRPLTDPDAALRIPATVGRTDGRGRLEVPRFRHAEIALAIGDVEAGWRQVALGGDQETARVVVREQGAIDGVFLSGGPAQPRRSSWARATPDPGLVRQRAYAPMPVLVAPEADLAFVMPRMEAGTWIVEEVPWPSGVRGLRSLLAALFGELEDPPRAVATVRDGERVGVRLAPRLAVGPEEQPEEPRLHGQVEVEGVQAFDLRWSYGEGIEVPLLPSGGFDLGTGMPAQTFRLHDRRVAGGAALLWEGRIEPSVGGALLALQTGGWSALLRGPSGDAAGAGIRLEGRAAPVRAVAAGGPASAAFTARAEAGGFANLPDVTHGTYSVRIRHAEQGWLDLDNVVVGPGSVTIGQSLTLNAPLRARGSVDFTALRVDAVRGSKLVWTRQPGADGIAVERTGICDDDGRFETAGLLPGRYRLELRVARRIRGVDGRVIRLPPETTKEVVALADHVLEPGAATGLRFARRR